MSRQEAYQKGRLAPDPHSWSLQATGLRGRRSLGRGSKSPANIRAVSCSKAGGLGVQEEIQCPGRAGVKGGTSFLRRRQSGRDKLLLGACLQRQDS